MTPAAGRRILFHVPVVHSAEDLGSLAQGAKERLTALIGREAATRRIAAIAGWWRELDRHVSGLPIDWERTRLYQDGLPVCQHELAIARCDRAVGVKRQQLADLGIDALGRQVAGRGRLRRVDVTNAHHHAHRIRRSNSPRSFEQPRFSIT